MGGRGEDTRYFGLDFSVASYFLYRVLHLVYIWWGMEPGKGSLDSVLAATQCKHTSV